MKLESQTFICDEADCRAQALVFQNREERVAAYVDLIQKHRWFVDTHKINNWKHYCPEHKDSGR